MNRNFPPPSPAFTRRLHRGPAAGNVVRMSPRFRHLLLPGILALQLHLAASAAWSQESTEPGLADRTKESLQETQEKVKDSARNVSDSVAETSRSAARNLSQLWQRVDETRLRNRTRDELVAWIIMGTLVGSLAGMFSNLKPTGAGRAGRLLLGLAGAFLGGVIVHVTRLDLGWGPVLIRYEELLFAAVGAVLLLVLGRFLKSRMKRRED